MIFNEELDNSNNKKKERKKNKKNTKTHNNITNENYKHDKEKYIKEEIKEYQILSIIYEDNNNPQGNEQTKNIKSEEKKFGNVADNPSIINIPINMIAISKELSEEIKTKKESYVNKKKKKKIII